MVIVEVALSPLPQGANPTCPHCGAQCFLGTTSIPTLAQMDIVLVVCENKHYFTIIDEDVDATIAQWNLRT